MLSSASHFQMLPEIAALTGLLNAVAGVILAYAKIKDKEPQPRQNQRRAAVIST